LARREVIVGEAATGPRDTIGMTAEEMHAYLEALLTEEAAEAAAARGTSVEEELANSWTPIMPTSRGICSTAAS
jgi:hypothetical protein